MVANIPLFDIEMALQQAKQRAFSAAGRTAQAQHLPRFQRKVEVAQHRRGAGRIAKLADRSLQHARFRRRLPIAILDRRRFRQQRADAAPGGAAALDDVEHPRQRQHRPDHQAEIHDKAGELTERQLVVPHHPAAAANRQQVREADSDIDGRVESGVDARHAQVFCAGIARNSGELIRLVRLQAERLNHADAGQALLRLVVQAGESRLRQLKTIVQLVAVAVDKQRHDRHRHQRQQRQLPADLQAHHQQHHAAHHQRIHQRQHPFTGGENHAIHVVSGACDKIAGAMTQIKGGMLAAKLAIEIFAQFDGQLIRGAEQQHAPDVAQQIGRHGGDQHHADPHKNSAPAHGVMRDAINDHAYQMRRQQLQDSDNDQESDRAQIASPLADKIPT